MTAEYNKCHLILPLKLFSLCKIFVKVNTEIKTYLFCLVFSTHNHNLGKMVPKPEDDFK
jgi:hypothetical protein